MSDGEPTLDANLGRVIRRIRHLGVRVAVITNASLIDRRDVQVVVARNGNSIADLPAADHEALRRTGLTHFVAVSGSNVALFLAACGWVVAWLVGTLWAWRRRARPALVGLLVAAAGVTPALGPDATPLGQIFWYTLEGRDEDGDPTGGWDLDELRTVQDWYVRYALQSAEGVSEVASATSVAD